VGLDISSAMLGVAARRGVYENVIRHDLAEPIPFDDGAFAASLLIGALGPGHAPPACVRELVRVTAPGGLVVLNVVAASWEEQGLRSMFEVMEAEGLWREVDRSPEWDVYGSDAQSVPAIVLAFRVS
jgi:SAM-dependent methyltransferase